ncbi:PP2C family protein-serine/threonine phosphatase [Cellulomonas marina]|uniref:Serine/threonine protein phosphatase PstP n=1 Tax=Cellulomonas marina TaxID=988821 RepID=A0A1I1AAD7_9CELL|nr:PP2C family serine/threonine-protein phosphatase [Cellulomonas marina]GIG30384.1 serine/threonine protein phosphatase [Cellulomonas marina]SFB34961.1 protein phosphatase [Cellulomonas marina]
MAVALRYAARSDVGLVRANNQDSAYAGPHLLVVADGMGGHAGGDVASSVAVAALVPLDDEAHGPDDALHELEDALEVAREEIIARSDADPTLAGMGTTVTAILRTGNKLAMLHLGDSRGYLLRGGVLTQVTADHTYVQHLVDTGRITAEEAETHPQRSVVMRVLGDFDADTTPDLSVREARPGDRWLLCSDGLSGFVSAETMAETLATVPDVEECADRLVQLALRAGGGDNVTVVVADVVDLDALPDGAAPSQRSAVVGAAATTRHSPTSAAASPAARAAALAHEVAIARAAGGGAAGAAGATRAGDDEDEAPRRRRWRGPLLAVVLVLLVAGGLAGAYAWTQTQYFVGASDGRVAVFRGLPDDLGPLRLSSVVERSSVQVEDLPVYQREQLEDTIAAASLAAARGVVDNLEEQVAQDEARQRALSPSPSPSPSASATATPEPVPGAGGEPLPTPGADGTTTGGP